MGFSPTGAVRRRWADPLSIKGFVYLQAQFPLKRLYCELEKQTRFYLQGAYLAYTTKGRLYKSAVLRSISHLKKRISCEQVEKTADFSTGAVRRRTPNLQDWQPPSPMPSKKALLRVREANEVLPAGRVLIVHNQR